MMTTTKNFCFCTLAIGHAYRLMAQDLAQDLAKYSPGTFFYILTDNPQDFASQNNVVAFKYYQRGIQRCYNDKRFIIERVFSDFSTAIYIDADTKIIDNFPDELVFPPGVTAVHENLIEHITKYRPESLEMIKKVASKLEISLTEAQWIGEALFVVTKDGGKGQEFINLWGLIATYAQLRGMHSGEGNLMGLAAAKIGWDVSLNDSWKTLNKLTQHLDASHFVKRSRWEQLKRTFGYHYRLNKERLLALRNFDFYYR
ncbi:conserved hypothetical protein [Rippkaea orientalis PCC 8801]|uniref:Glycosyl transferase family 8 n=1 Tax=Rippkaea orientalis (strain PCC 8801 / RF-1) TaxID=41431 RepID=B7K094_RIPO1|nr:hypothetical protein [Rippkaea orientalis]ACK67378.1 conserved hypothetical protein [Rippkaea orientalis PCC 8801]